MQGLTKAAAVVAAFALTLVGLVLGTTAMAQAHTPSGGADCTSVHAEGASYQAADTNTVSVRLGAKHDELTFATDGSVSLSVPQDGRSRYYEWSVVTTNPNPAYQASGHGWLRCGERADRHTWWRTTKADKCGWKNDEAWTVTGKHATGNVVRKGRTRFVATARADDGYVFKGGETFVRVVVHTTNRGGCGGHIYS